MPAQSLLPQDFHLDIGLDSLSLASGTQPALRTNSSSALNPILLPLAAINGDDAANTLVGTNGADVLRGLGGNDILDGRGGADELDGGAGEDTATYANSTSGLNVYLIQGGPSTGDAAGDRFTSIENLIGSAFDDQLYGDPNANKIYGGAGHDTLYGWGGADWLYGDAGDDNVVGGSGVERMFGGDGKDTLSYQLSTVGLTVSLLDPSINTGDAAGDQYSGFEDVTGTPFDDILYGDNGPLNNLWGLAGNDKIYGGGGYDVMIGDAGADYLDGGADRDMADYETADAGVVASLLDPSINTGHARGDVYVNIEDIAGSLFNDELHGDNLDNNMIGWPGADRLYGEGGNDGLEGGPGADHLDGGAGVDTAGYSTAGTANGFNPALTVLGIGVTASMLNPLINRGDAAGDTYANIENLLGSAFADTLQGDNANNSILGGGGNDQLLGEGGDDLLDGGAGGDALNGGDGFDYATYDHSAQGVAASLGNPAINTGEAAGDTYAGIEGLMGSAFNDLLAGDNAVNRLVGGAGNDSLYGAGGDDFLYGGAGADLMDGGDGKDTVTYSSAGAAVTASLQNAAVNTGEAAGDTYGSIEVLEGSAFADTLYGYDFSANTLYGGGGDDKLFGGAGEDLLIGGAGADVFDGRGGIDMVSYVTSTAGVVASMLTPVGSQGDSAGDTFVNIENLAGSHFADELRGNDSANILLGLSGDDRLFGGGGDDNLIGGLGGDLLSGGAGLDTVGYAEATSGVTAFLLGAFLNTGEAAGDSYDSIENMIGSSFGDILGGSDVQNTIFGGLGDDVIYAAGGEDLLEGGAGADYLDGQAGYDYVSYSAAQAGVIVFMGGNYLNTGDAKGDTLVNVEGILGSQYGDIMGGDDGGNTLQGGGGGDYLFGANANDYLVGGEGNDFLFGGNDNDTMEGGVGDDLLNGGLGADYLTGGDGTDTASYSDAAGGVIAFLLGASSNSGEAAGDVYSSIENLTGSNFGDYLGGTDGANEILGGGGNDTIWAGGGDDVIDGGAGADALYGQVGVDIASYASATAGVTAFLGGAFLNTGDAAGDQYFEIEGMRGSQFGDILGGTDAVNSLEGLGGNDTIYGGGGADQITGGEGSDTLNGGAGADTFFFLRPSEGGDTIQDFTVGQDRLLVSQYWFGQAMGASGPLDASHFVSGDNPVAQTTAASFLFNTATHQLYYDADGLGGQDAVLLASFSNGVNLTAGDIWTV
jgi:Ca2+-binding RTX toxin-like protein